MKIEVIGKNGFTPSAANREYAEKKLRKLEDFFGEERLVFYIDYHAEEPVVRYDPGDGWAAITADGERHTVSIWTGGEGPTVQPPEEEENYNNQVFFKHVYPGDTWKFTL